MKKTRPLVSVTLAILCLAAGAYGGRLSLQEHAAVQESLAQGHDAGLDFRYCGLTMSER